MIARVGDSGESLRLTIPQAANFKFKLNGKLECAERTGTHPPIVRVEPRLSVWCIEERGQPRKKEGWIAPRFRSKDHETLPVLASVRWVRVGVQVGKSDFSFSSNGPVHVRVPGSLGGT